MDKQTRLPGSLHDFMLPVFELRGAIPLGYAMGMTNPAVAATQFTAFMGMSNLAISYGNYWQGMVAERMGYATVLYADALIGLLVIAIIPFLRPREAPVVVVPPVGKPAVVAAAAAGDS